MDCRFPVHFQIRCQLLINTKEGCLELGNLSRNVNFSHKTTILLNTAEAQMANNLFEFSFLPFYFLQNQNVPGAEASLSLKAP